MLDQLKQFFKTPTADQLANREYDEARRELLASQSAAEYRQSMIDYQIKRLLRLKEIIDASPEDDK